jgi:3-methyladenine DNA glycosylase AlkC
MAERLKNMFFTASSINDVAGTLKEYYPGFDKEKFTRLVFTEDWESKELKERMRHTTTCLHKTLPESYEEALDILKKAAPFVKGFEAMSLPDYVECYGMDDWNLSLPALRHFTKYSSSEFAIRPFLDRDPEKTMAMMSAWAEDKDPKVRRFASEGCRPRLPWAMALPKFKKDPSLILPVLEKLKNDESDSVRRSVANNLNDISKDNPESALEISERWYGRSKHTDEIVKHACRTMLKTGNKRALLIFGYGDPSHIGIENFSLNKETAAIGESLRFAFELIINEQEKRKLRLEYAVYFMKANGKLSKKVFQIIEKEYEPGRHLLSRKHSFVDMTTRRHYPGEHRISIIVNGEEKVKIPLQIYEAHY